MELAVDHSLAKVDSTDPGGVGEGKLTAGQVGEVGAAAGVGVLKGGGGRPC